MNKKKIEALFNKVLGDYKREATDNIMEHPCVDEKKELEKLNKEVERKKKKLKNLLEKV